MKPPRTLLPWHENQWRQFQDRREAGTLPHALLLTGPVGIGKELFALHAAWSLLCQEPDERGRPCGRCRGCDLLSASTHPDLLWVTLPPAGADGTVADRDRRAIRVDLNADPPEHRGRWILVEQARALIEELGLTSQMGGRKVAVVCPADRLIWNAANALLKTLEEPAPGTLLILVATETARLPATVRSRCQRLHFAVPGADTAMVWLAAQLPDVPEVELGDMLGEAGGAPLRALESHASGALGRRARALEAFVGVAGRRVDPVKVAAEWAKEPGFSDAAEWLYGWCRELIRLRMGAPAADGTAAGLQAMAERVDLDALFVRFSAIEEARALAETNLRPELVLADLLSAWVPDERRS